MANVRDGYIVPPLQLEDVPMDSEDRSGPANEMPKYVTSGTLKERPCKRATNYCRDILEFFGRRKVTVLTTFAFIAICALFLAFMLRIWIVSDDIGNRHHRRVASKVLLENKQNQLKEQTPTKEEFPSNGIKPRPSYDADLKLPDDLLNRYEDLYKYFSQGDSTRFKRDTDDEKMSVCRRKSQDCKVMLDKVRRILAVVDYNVNELRNTLPLFPDSAYIADCLECKRFEADSSSDISDDTPEVDNKSRRMNEINNLLRLDTFFIKDQLSYMTTKRSSVYSVAAQQTESNGYRDETTVVQFQQASYANGNSEDSSTSGQTVEAGSSPVTSIRQNTDFESSETIDDHEISRDRVDKKIVENNPVIENSTTTPNFSEASAILDSGTGANPILAQPEQRDSFAAESHIGESSAKPAGARISDGFSESELRIVTNPDAPAVGPTGEFMTLGQQLHHAPPMVPMCFYGLPFTSHGRSGNIDLPMTLPDDQQSMQRVPIPYQPNPVPIQYPQRVGPTGPGVQSPRQLPYFCTYVPTPNFQFPAVPSAPLYQRNAAEVSAAGGEGAPRGARGRLDSIFQDYSTACDHDARLCADGSRCVKKVRWCDGHVDCPDASDEAKCSCRDRIGLKRLCDGYFDCPHGEDEFGCFGCGRHQFSCDDRNTRYPKKNCIPLSQRCDGLKNCQNGKDETDCATLSQTFGDNDVFPVGHVEGYLHKNWKGQWYPVCTPLMNWAMQACRSEIGPEVRQRPLVQYDHSPKNLYEGPYLVENAGGIINTVPNCFDKAVYVRCPPMPCGTRLMLEGNAGPAFDDTFDDHFMEGSRKSDGPVNGTVSVQNGAILAEDIPLAMERSADDRVNVTDSGEGNDTIVNAESRVVGGRNSESTAWPFLVAIFRDGLFHCGGAILDEYWILSAAHCVDNFQEHYFEVQAGVLRLVSYSPTSQIRQVKYVVTYEGYEWVNRMGDIALIRLDEPLHFNRWVRPVCLPEDMTAGLSWRHGPLPGEECVAMGWGSALEQRVNPDHMREMPVTILPFCEHQIDHNEATFCAESQGSRDRCQGSSGGTLMCRNPEYPSNWYIAGIVSHGDGCRRPDEPTVYTKVSSFADWIRQVVEAPPRTSFAKRPLRRCTGFRCEGGFSRCLPSSKRCDGTVDCLDAEDELHCFGLHNQNDVYKQHGSGIDVNNSSNQSSFEERQEDSPFGDAILTRIGGDRPEEANSDKSQELYDNSTSTNPSSEGVTETNIQTSTMPVASELPENITETAVKNKTSVAKSSVSRHHFTCTMLIQNIPIKKRCDNNVDCEDGSDEMGCTCKDYLKNVNPTAICDGHTDCRDNSDEENCDTCNENQFHCRRSGQCISMSQRCDRHMNCALNEDEEDCFALTNGDYVKMDLDDRPHLNTEGVITWYVNGQWRPACYRKDAGEVDKLGEFMCNYFGFGGLAVIDGTPVADKPLELKPSSEREVLPYEYPPDYVGQQDNNGTCAGFYLRCIPGIVSGANAHLVDTQNQENRTYLWPWHAAIFVDGWYRCSAALLDQQWLLTNSHCTVDIDVTRNYTAAMLGMSRSYFYVDGPHQQLAQVDAIRHVMPADAVLLHLRYPVNFTRHVQPLFYQKKIYAPSKDDPCVAVGVDEGPHTKSVFLQPVLDNCSNCYRCFERVQHEEKCNENGTHNMWSGTIACRSKSGAWYPAAVYHEPNGSCGFRDMVTFTSINCIDKLFLRVMSRPIKSSENPPCDGFRCSLGRCISENKVCDGVPDCRDGTDEDPERCRLIKENCDNGVIDVSNCKCGRSEIRCKNGQCIPKQAFCDGHVDCSDGTDEPSNCNCAAYLKLAEPSRICDGSRDCLDKSDEDPKVCSCKESSFECPATDERDASCVPQDFVCDGVADCPGGYDEKRCRTIKGASEDSQGTGEVQKRSYGMWHSECFPEEATSPKMVADLCRTLGYTSGTIAENATSRIGPATVPRLAQFYMVRLNDRCWIKMKGDGPMVTAVPAEDACNRLFVNCL